MGYYSYIEIHSDSDEHEEIIKSFRQYSQDAEYCLEENGYGVESAKWHELESDLRWLSKSYPNVMFHCYRNGEESEDFEKIYATGGKLQSVYGEVVYPEFNRKELK